MYIIQLDGGKDNDITVSNDIGINIITALASDFAGTKFIHIQVSGEDVLFIPVDRLISIHKKGSYEE